MNTKNLFAVALVAGLISGAAAQADHHEGATAATGEAKHDEKSCKNCGGKKKAKAKAKAEKAEAKAEEKAEKAAAKAEAKAEKAEAKAEEKAAH